ncbi:MAG: SDR family NAD(P)-dependent oxidoreductase [Planctomycetia bacterium]|nr:SDR family NAD(P)-dependent oxidoreductase [Planctomycetia bacterium]
MKKVAIVTGVSRGIGYGISLVLAQADYRVIMIARNQQRLAEIEKEFKDMGLDVKAIPLDITDRPAVRATIADILADYGQVDVLVNCAGLMPLPQTLVDMDDQLWDDMITVNLTGTYNVTKAVLPAMIEKKFGRIINFSSVSATKPVQSFVGYGTAKGGLHAFTAALANEVSKFGVTVNAIAPGFVETEEMHRIWGSVARDAGVSEESMLAPFWQQIPLGRWIQREEIGRVILFLASDTAAIITGQLLIADGGYDNRA